MVRFIKAFIISIQFLPILGMAQSRFNLSKDTVSETGFVGSWTVDQQPTVVSMNVEDRVGKSNIESKDKEIALASLSDRKYIFYEDQSFKTVWTNGDWSKTLVGKWSLHKNLLTLYINSNEFRYTLVFENREVIELIPQEESRGLIKKLVLKRNPENEK